MDAAQLPAPQLGRILIAAGLLSEEQLAQALEEQERTGRRLGEIIVQRGFVSGPALANALAEQHGGVLKTEYGFASGLGGVVAKRAASEAGAAVSPLRPPAATTAPQLRTAAGDPEPPGPAAEEGPVKPFEPLGAEEPEPTPTQQAPFQPPSCPEPAESAEPPEQLEPTPAPLLRTAESPAHAPEEPTEPFAPYLMAPPSAPLEHAEQAPPPPASEREFVSSPALEPEPVPLTEAAEPLPEPVELRPSAEPVQESPPARELEPEPAARIQLEPTPPAEAKEPLPEPVELRPPTGPVQEPPSAREPELATPLELEPSPTAEAAEPVLEPAPMLAQPDDREALIESLHARVEAQGLELAKLREELEQERTRKDVQVHVWPEEQAPAVAAGPAQTENYLLCVPTTAGYVLLDRVGALPNVGQAVDVPEEEGHFTVTKVVRLPRNGRPCAYLQHA